MPLLYALAQHDALEAARQRLNADDWLFAYLDDLYLVTTRERAHAAFVAVTEEVEEKAGVRTHLGKLRLWSRAGGTCPPGFEGFGPDVWAGGADSAHNGIKVLGTPLGRQEFVKAHADERLGDEKRFLDRVRGVRDL